jgi:hypothetical protein
MLVPSWLLSSWAWLPEQGRGGQPPPPRGLHSNVRWSPPPVRCRTWSCVSRASVCAAGCTPVGSPRILPPTPCLHLVARLGTEGLSHRRRRGGPHRSDRPRCPTLAHAGREGASRHATPQFGPTVAPGPEASPPPSTQAPPPRRDPQTRRLSMWNEDTLKWMTMVYTR